MNSKIKEKVKLSVLYSLAIGPILIGGNLFLYFMDRIPWYEGESTRVLDYVWLNMIVLGTFVLTIFLMKKGEKRRGKIPAADERTLQVMKNYLLSALSVIFFLSLIVLLALFFIGVETIEIGWIFVYLSVLIISTLIGAFIASKA